MRLVVQQQHSLLVGFDEFWLNELISLRRALSVSVMIPVVSWHRILNSALTDGIRDTMKLRYHNASL